MAKKILVCTAWPYVHAIPHFGNIMPFLTADAIARFHKANGYDVEFVSGSDEHGSKMEFEAIKLGITPKELVDKNHALLKKYIEQLGFSFTNYSRTSNEVHKKFAQDFYKKVYDNGFIEFKEEKQLFCEKDKIFLPERYVVGICPHCESDHALGNQCDECGRVLEPTELLKPKCSLCGSHPVIKPTETAFFKLQDFEKQLVDYIKTKTKKKVWQERVINFSNRWITEGLLNRPITRDLKWGIHAPFPELKNKTIYVWAEAVLGYLSTLEERGRLNEFWKEPIERSYFTLGKDNIPFHTIILPALLMAHGGYNLPDRVVSNEYLGFDGKQFSKTQGRGIWLDEVLDVLPADYWRFYLYRIFPETRDTDFSWADFGEKINNELVANIANFVNRVVTLLHKYYRGNIPFVVNLKPEEENIIFEIKEIRESMSKLLIEGKVRGPLDEILKLSSLGNEFLQKQEPWKNPENKDCLATCALICKAIGIFIEPFLPFTSQKIKELFNISNKDFKWVNVDKFLKGEVNEPVHLFDKIDIKNIVESVENKRKYSIFQKFDLRIAKIESVEDYPNADKMYKIKIDLGELGKRQICAGLKLHFKKEDLLGKNVVVVANLKPAILRGEKSEGMMLAAEDKYKNLGILQSPDSEAGDEVYLCGSDGKNCVEKKPVNEISIDEFYAEKLKVKVGRILCKGKMLFAKSSDGDFKEIIVYDVEDGGEVR